MEEYKPVNKGTTQLFDNPVLEGLTRTNFWFPVSIYYILAVAVLSYGLITQSYNFWIIPVLFIGGLIIFSLVEYMIHRFLFHFPAKTQKQKELIYTVHGVHHEFPRDKDRLVMPPVVSIILAGVFFVSFYFLIGKYAFIFFPGFIAGYSTYLFIHYAVHAYKPPKNFLKYLWKHHSLHHYKDTDTAFAVSFPFWDIIFGTMPGERKHSHD